MTIDWATVWKPTTWRDLARKAADEKNDQAAVKLLIDAVEAAILAKIPAPKGTAGRLIGAWRTSGRSVNE